MTPSDCITDEKSSGSTGLGMIVTWLLALLKALAVVDCCGGVNVVFEGFEGAFEDELFTILADELGLIVVIVVIAGDMIEGDAGDGFKVWFFVTITGYT